MNWSATAVSPAHVPTIRIVHLGRHRQAIVDLRTSLQVYLYLNCKTCSCPLPSNDLPPRSIPQALAADSAGGFYIISSIVENSGARQLRVLQTDAVGNTLASMDFGGTAYGAGTGDRVAGAAVDSKGNLVMTEPHGPMIFPLFRR